MSTPIVNNFMRQQGFPDEPADACNMRFAGLYFQPRIVFPLVLLGIVLQSPWIFLGLSFVLWWNVLVPGFNPFERAYNRMIAGPRGRTPLGPAPGPRRFAQGMAAAFLLEVTDRPHSPDLRFDAIGVVIDARGKLVRLDHLEAAF